MKAFSYCWRLHKQYICHLSIFSFVFFFFGSFVFLYLLYRPPSTINHHLMSACNISGSSYRYMADLAQLDSCRRTSPMLQAQLSKISTPLHVEAWSKYLGRHPDQAYARYIINGITKGFRIGLEGSSIPPAQTQRNMKSAYENPQIISAYIESEITKNRMVGPVIDANIANAIHTSPFGAIPKQHQPGKWRLIVNLSSPKSISGYTKCNAVGNVMGRI